MTITISAISDIEAYRGPNEIEGIRFRPARAALGVSAWGMNVIELDPNCTGYPEHDHAEDGQEEVYVVLEGEAELQVGEERHTLRRGQMVRLPADVRRKWVTHNHSVALLALGGTPGQAYSAE